MPMKYFGELENNTAVLVLDDVNKNETSKTEFINLVSPSVVSTVSNDIAKVLPSSEIVNLLSGKPDVPSLKTIDGVELAGTGAVVIKTAKESVSIIGSSDIIVGVSQDFLINNHSSFITYTVSVDNGTATITGNKITVTANVAGYTTLTVSTTNSVSSFLLFAKTSFITKPIISSPINGSLFQSVLPTITAGAVSFRGATQNHISTKLQISTTSNFSTFTEIIKTNGTLTEVEITTPLEFNTKYYVRLAYTGDVTQSKWSDISSFVTVKQLDSFSTINSVSNAFVFNCVAEDKNGDFIAVGFYLTATDGYNTLLVKLSKTGDVIWQKQFGGVKNDINTWVTVNSNNEYIVVGRNNTTGDSTLPDILVTKLENNGTVLWQRNFGGPGSIIPSFVTTSDNNDIIVIGYENSGLSNASLYRGLIIKLNTHGDIYWKKIITETTGYIQLTSAAVDKDKNIICIGFARPIARTTVFLLKMNQNGEVLWQKRLNAATITSASQSVIVDNDNNYVIAGSFNGNPLILKTDSSGNLISKKTRTENGNSGVFRSISLDSDGGYLLFGYDSFDTLTPSKNTARVIKLNTKLEVVWSKIIGNSTTYINISMGFTVNDGYVVVYSAGNNIYRGLIKFNRNEFFNELALVDRPTEIIRESDFTFTSITEDLETTTYAIGDSPIEYSTVSFQTSAVEFTFTKSVF